ncbi:hypothetical protein ACMX2M_17010 [Paenibacillus polymyxa]
MKKKFKLLFQKSINTIDWIESPGFLGMQKAGNIIAIMLLSVGFLTLFLDDRSKLLNNIIFGIVTIVLYTIFFLSSTRFFWVKPLKFIRKNAENPGQLFDSFGHWPFLYGVFIYSFFSSLFIGVIFFTVAQAFLQINLDTSKLFYNLFFLTTSIYSILYFMYHVAVKEVSTKIVKARTRFYLAIIATVTAGLFGISAKEILTPLITYLGIGFAWLSFFVEKIESESK